MLIEKYLLRRLAPNSSRKHFWDFSSNVNFGIGQNYRDAFLLVPLLESVIWES